MGRAYFCGYFSFLESLEPYSDEEVGRIFRACLVYASTGTEPHFAGNERFVWPTIKQTIDRDQAYYSDLCAKNKANRQRSSTTVNDRPRSSTVVNDRDEQEEEREEYINKNISKEESTKEERPKKFKPPTVDEVRAYCQDRGNNVDPDKFVSYYAARGWKLNRSPMVDWKAAVRTWERNASNDRKPIVSIQPVNGRAEMEDMKRFLESMGG